MNSAQRFGLATVLVIFLSDQALKIWLLYGVGLAENGPFDLTPFMTIVLAWNRGISYGLFQQGTDLGRWLLVLLSFGAAIWLWRWMWRSERRFTVLSLALIIGGALGNGLDRAVYGAVVDFVHLHWGDFSWYIFNIADVAIVVGVLGLLYESFHPETEKTA
ncbi:signal peptidase II [Bosea sp. BH3]|uniref:signal peptidase II n=1 Tax=Bosea sp. BH3 TaxID=2871701 RepID=UPI0021CB2851|nr:signal peptidase II [Bosea sp. BH3]MCU4179143.1 signal peptidase II [Bosea sp. BH3]